MINYVLVILGVAIFSSALPQNQLDNDLLEIDSIYQEKKCIMQGGLCVIQADCLEPTTTKGLCPEQQHRGVECCYGISVKEKRCQRRGGICVDLRSACSDKLILYANDCPTDKKCCVSD